MGRMALWKRILPVLVAPMLLFVACGNAEVTRTVSDDKRPFDIFNPEVTLEFHDTELRDICRILKAYSGRNIVIAPSTPSIVTTAAFFNVPFADAFEALLKTYGLGWKKNVSGDVVVGIPLPRKTEKTSDADSPIFGDTGPFPGGPITLVVREAPLQKIFKTLGRVANKNVILDPSLLSMAVSGKWENVPVGKIADDLINTYDLVCKPLDEHAVFIGTAKGLARLKIPETRAFPLVHTDPAAMKKFLVASLDLPGEILLVEPPRTILATSDSKTLKKIDSAIRAQDRPGAQIRIRLRLIGFSDEAKSQIQELANSTYDRLQNACSILPDELRTETTVNAWREFDAALAGMAEHVEVMLDRTATTIEGIETNMNLIGYEGKAMSLRSIIGARLYLTPRIREDGFIVLKIRFLFESVALLYRDKNAVLETRLVWDPERQGGYVATVRLWDGEPFVFGQLFTDEWEARKRRIPELAGMPGVKEAFTGLDRTRRVIAIITAERVDAPDISKAPPEGSLSPR